MRKLIKINYIIILSLIFMSCSTEEEVAQEEAPNSAPIGTFVQSCTDEYYNVDQHIKTLIFTDSELIYKKENYDDDCSDLEDIIEHKFNTLSYDGENVSWLNGSLGRGFTVVVYSKTITPKLSSDVTSKNNSSYCGLSDWAINTSKKVSGLTCGSTDYPSVGTKVYSNYGLVGTSTLYADSPVFSTTGYQTSVQILEYTKQ